MYGPSAGHDGMDVTDFIKKHSREHPGFFYCMKADPSV
jgi:hypothetical protein